ERPRYGYYLDHVVDAFSTAAIGAGIGLSPYVDLGVALAGVLAYLILSINIYLESQAFGVFRLGYSRIGPTEARIVLVAANIALALSGPGAAVVPVATGAAAALVVGMFVMVAVRIGRNLSQLARLETAPPPDPTTRGLPPHRVHRGQGIHVPRPHFPQPVARERTRRLGEDRRDLIGLQLPARRFLHQRHHAHDVGGRHRGAGRAGVILLVRRADGAAARQIEVVVRVAGVEHR